MDPDSIAARLHSRLTGSPHEPGGDSSPPPPVPDHEILKEIGVGSYGGVWLARSAGGQLRAVKVVWRSRFSSERPYEREFKGILQFEPISRSHPGVVDILHLGRDDEAGCFYYVMELADPAAGASPAATEGAPGSSLSPAFSPARYAPRTLASDLKTRGPLPLTEVLTLGVQLAGALGHLHHHRLVHRDVKPSNVIFVGGQAKLADIGLVAGTDEARSFVGTEGFIPPEGPGSVQADIFGLGRLLYEAATGRDRCEFPELPSDLEARSSSERVVLLELNEILARACAPKPSNRHANAAELAGDINLILAGRSVRHAYGIERRLKRASRAVGLAVIVVVLASVALWFQQVQRRRAEARARQETALRTRAEAAEQLAREQLRESLLNQASARMRGSEPDRRTRALAALERAGAILPGLDLRNAAIAALATPELRVIRRWSPRAVGSWESWPDSSLRRYAWRHDDGSMSIHAIENDAELVRLPGLGVVTDFSAFSPDGSWLGVRYHDGSLRAWHLRSRTSRMVCARAEKFVFAPDSGTMIATCSDGGIYLFDLASGRKTIRSRSTSIEILAVHPTKPLFLTSSYGQGTIEIRRTGDGSLVRDAVVPPMGYHALWSADGQALITTHRDFSVQVWDWPRMGTPRLVLRLHQAEPTSLATDFSGRLLVTAGWDTQIFFFDLRDGRLLLSEAGQDAYAAGDRSSFLLVNDMDWSLVDLEPPFAIDAIAMHDRMKSPRDVAFSPDGHWIATAGPDGVRILDLRSRSVHSVMVDQDVLSVAFSPDSKRLYAVTPDHPLAWRIDADRATGFPRTESLDLPFSGERRFLGTPTAGIFANGEQWLAVRMDRQRSGGAWIHGRFDSPGIESTEGFETGGSEPKVSPDGRWLAWGNWHARNAAVTRLGARDPPIVLPSAGSATVAFSPDNRLLAVGGVRELRFYETVSWRSVLSIPRTPARPLPPQFAFAHDSRVCAVALPPDRMIILDTRTGQELAELPAGGHLLSRPAFSPDDRLLAIACEDHHTLIWDLPALRGKLRDLGLDWRLAPEGDSRALARGP
jgi:serine/threonine protein kinase/WD40 repeat protein